MSKKLIEYNFPEDLKKMSDRELELLSYEIRDFLIDKVSKTGGHIASNLGVVELTIALHKFFDSPKDKIIWDVGHQAYVHKILTGRIEGFDTLRQTGGMSGFPKWRESDHDVVDTGHSSTSISTAAGMAAARDLKNEDYNIVAVIGDGSLTGGVAFEALNNVGAAKSNITIILNDNGMSISQNTGSLSQHLSKLRTAPGYLDLKNNIKKALKDKPSIYRSIVHFKDTIKYAMTNGALFEELGVSYLGPVDGHNINEIIRNLELAQKIEGPVIIHTITQKGKGYKNAEMNPNKFHGIGPFDATTGVTLSKSSGISFSDAFGDKLCKMAEEDENVVAVCAAMIDGTGLQNFALNFPEKIFDVGIAEGHAVSFAAGLAKAGMKPFVAIYSTFLQRAYDEILIDVCLNNLPVIFAIDRAGNVGADGETHHGIFDISYLSHMPNMTILSPRDTDELAQMMDYAKSLNGPCTIRYPRGSSPVFNDGNTFEGHNYVMVNQSPRFKKSDVEIWASGKMISVALEAIKILNQRSYKVNLVNTAILKPLDTALIDTASKHTKYIVTLEDNILDGGFGHAVTSYIAESNIKLAVKNLGWPTKFIEHGNTDDLFKKYRLDGVSVAERICEFIER